jgi:hypothetical protein
MSKTLTNNAVAEFDAIVKQAYQGMGMLRETVRLRSGVVGSTYRFPKIGKGTATRRVPQTRVVPMNIAHTKATATIEDWNAPEFTDIFDQQKVNYDEQQALAEVISGAIGRREDQLILDALDAASTTLTISTDIGGTSSGLNTAKCRRARRLLNQQGVPKNGMRTACVSSYGMEQLLGDDDANTVDKNIIKALVDGEITRWLAFDFKEMEDRDEGGLPVASSVRTSYFYHNTAIGLAQGIEFRTEINYIPDMTSWLANGIFAAGSVAIDALGIVEVSTTES